MPFRCSSSSPQCVVWTFTLVWLITDRGWSAAAAGAMVTFAQILGAAGRIAAGRWSDRSGFPTESHSGPSPSAAAVSMGLLAADRPPCARRRAIAVMVASRPSSRCPTTAWRSPRSPRSPARSGAAGRSARRTPVSCLMAGIVPPLSSAALITAAGFPLAFAVCAAVPVDRAAVGAGARRPDAKALISPARQDQQGGDQEAPRADERAQVRHRGVLGDTGRRHECREGRDAKRHTPNQVDPLCLPVA